MWAIHSVLTRPSLDFFHLIVDVQPMGCLATSHIIAFSFWKNLLCDLPGSTSRTQPFTLGRSVTNLPLTPELTPIALAYCVASNRLNGTLISIETMKSHFHSAFSSTTWLLLWWESIITSKHLCLKDTNTNNEKNTKKERDWLIRVWTRAQTCPNFRFYCALTTVVVVVFFRSLSSSSVSHSSIHPLCLRWVKKICIPFEYTSNAAAIYHRSDDERSHENDSSPPQKGKN